MAALEVDMILNLVDRASGPAKAVMARMGLEKGGARAAAGQINAANGAMLALNRQMAAFAAGAGAYLGFQGLAGGAADLESQLTAIQKKAGTTAEETRKIGEEALALANSGDLATSIDEIMAAFERGAAAGIPLNELSEFARLSAMAADAFEMAAADVGNAAVGFKVQLGIDMSEMEEYFGLINKLADSGIADEAGIINFLDRSGAQLKLFGISAEQAAAYASTLANIKMPPETAARMMNTLTSKLLSPGSKQAQAALKGIVGNVGAFHKLLKHDANKALEFFLQKVGALDKFQSAELLTGLLGQGFSDEVLRLAGAYDEVQRNQKVVADRASWENSLPETYKLKLDDFWSQWEQLKTAFDTLQIRAGEVGLPGLTAGLQSATRLVKDISDGLANFKVKVDTDELQAALKTLGELGAAIEDRLGMTSEDDDALSDRLAGVVNGLSAGVEMLRDKAETWGFAEPDKDTPQDRINRKDQITDATVDAASLINSGFGNFIEDLIARNADGQAAKTDRPTYVDATGRPNDDPAAPKREPIPSRFGYPAEPGGSEAPPQAESAASVPVAASWPKAPSAAEMQFFLATLGLAEQAKLRVEAPIVTQTDLNTAAFMAGLLAMENAAQSTAQRINSILGSISAPPVNGGGAKFGAALRSHLGDGAN